MRCLIASAQSQRIPVVLATHVYNDEFESKRYLSTLLEINEITRSLAVDGAGVFLVDAASSIRGTYELMEDVCHFRADRDGEARLVGLLAESIRTHASNWIQERSRTPTDSMAGRQVLAK